MVVPAIVNMLLLLSGFLTGLRWKSPRATVASDCGGKHLRPAAVLTAFLDTPAAQREQALRAMPGLHRELEWLASRTAATGCGACLAMGLRPAPSVLTAATAHMASPTTAMELLGL
jgi:hypothetical protein